MNQSRDSSGDNNGDNDEASNSDNIEPTESTLAIPNITQRDEPPSSTSSGSLVLKNEFAMKAEFEPHIDLAPAQYQRYLPKTANDVKFQVNAV